MVNKNIKHYSQSASYCFIVTGIIVSLLFATFFLAEPMVSHGNDTATFRIRQTITDETSFLVDPSNVTMAGNLNGVTGGNATGTTLFVVQSNNATGYYVNISFEHNGSEAMLGDVTSNEAIRDYGGDVGSEPSFLFVASSAAQFGYTITSNTPGDTDPSFHDDGAGNCNDDTNETTSACWKSPDLAAFRIVDRTTSAVTGATSTIQFKVNVPSSALPVPTAETYTATATLSLFTQ